MFRCHAKKYSCTYLYLLLWMGIILKRVTIFLSANHRLAFRVILPMSRKKFKMRASYWVQKYGPSARFRFFFLHLDFLYFGKAPSWVRSNSAMVAEPIYCQIVGSVGAQLPSPVHQYQYTSTQYTSTPHQYTVVEHHTSTPAHQVVGSVGAQLPHQCTSTPHHWAL